VLQLSCVLFALFTLTEYLHFGRNYIFYSWVESIVSLRGENIIVCFFFLTNFLTRKALAHTHIKNKWKKYLLSPELPADWKTKYKIIKGSVCVSVCEYLRACVCMRVRVPIWVWVTYLSACMRERERETK